MFRRILYPFSSSLRPNLGPCWPHVRSKWGDAIQRTPVQFPKAEGFQKKIVSILEGLGIDCRGFPTRVGMILNVFQKGLVQDVTCSSMFGLVLDGLVGSREALGNSLFIYYYEHKTRKLICTFAVDSFLRAASHRSCSFLFSA